MKNDLLKQSDNFVCRTLGEEKVLVPISQTGLDVQRIFSLNQTAAAVWERLEKPCSPQELVADLESAFDAPEGVIEKEVLGLLSEFLEHRFIIVTES